MQFRAGRYCLRYPGSSQFDGPAISQSGRSALHGESRVSWCVQWLAEQLIERHAPRIVQHEYGAVPVTSSFDRSGRPGRIQLFSQRIFVLQSFQSFRRGKFRPNPGQKYQEKGPLLVRSIFCPDQLRTGRCAISVITAGYALRGSWHGNCYRGS